MAERRVAVTGAGVISPIGNTLEDFHRSLCDARPGIQRLPSEIAQGSGVQVGAMVDWQPTTVLKESEAANLDRATQFALGAVGQALRTLAAADPSDAAASCKPFDQRRGGLVLGEGAAAFLLEDESRARSRGAPILALLTGYGNSCDAVHMSRPDRDGQVRAMREALAESRLAPGDIGYINAHGTATAVGDVVEAER